MLTYRSDTKLKTNFLKEIKWHREQDAIVQGSYGTQNGRWHGCAVACSLRSLDRLEGRELSIEYSRHADFEDRGLWPEWLARLEDQIFEQLPQEEAVLWPERLARAVPVGVDITKVKWQFCAYLLKENIDRVLKLEISDSLKEQVVSAIRGVLSVHENAIHTGHWDESAARSAARSAESVARSAESVARSAWTVARSAWSAASAESAARSAWSAESAARSAWSAESAASAASAARSAAKSAAKSAAYIRYSKELLRLLRACK